MPGNEPAPAGLPVRDREFVDRALESAARAPLCVDGNRDVRGENASDRELPREPRAFRRRESVEFPPTELPRGPPHVAVGAPHIALGDLNEDEAPRLAHRKFGDVAPLLGWVAMVEVEHHRVATPAIDAGVREEISDKQGAVLDTVVGDPRDLAADVLLAIRQVVRAPIRGLTLPAMALSGSPRHVRERELRLRFGLAAHVARDHARLRGRSVPLEHLF